MGLIHWHFIHAWSYMKETLHGICILCQIYDCLKQENQSQKAWDEQKRQKDLRDERKQPKKSEVPKEIRIPTKLAVKGKSR